jgi:hypothetical protein
VVCELPSGEEPSDVPCFQTVHDDDCETARAKTGKSCIEMAFAKEGGPCVQEEGEPEPEPAV